MKFEELLMQRNDDPQSRQDLEDEVIKLREDLLEQQKFSRALQFALHEPIVSGSRLSSLLPLQIWVLLADVATAEEEILCLERRIEELKMGIYEEKKQTEEWNMLQQHKHQMHLQQQKRYLRNQTMVADIKTSCSSSKTSRRERWKTGRKSSLGSASELSTVSSSSRSFNDEVVDRCRRNELRQNPRFTNHETCLHKPNRLSEELMRCLIGFVSKPPFNCKAPMFSLDDYQSIFDPYGILADLDHTVRDVGPYKNYIRLTRSTLDMSRLTECLPANGKLRFLMHKLCNVDISSLTYKQKLAFWINVYNACIMNAFLQHGLPSTPDHLLALMNKLMTDDCDSQAELNVGGIVLNALAIEHFILRHPQGHKNGEMDEKEMLLRRAYSLRIPEPNITFALSRGSWSSPALRIYTAEDVANELERAKAEYLEASVGVTSKKKIIVPKLLYWHMQDFADNIESLVEWIYSQLPQSGSLKQLIMECLNGETRSPISKMVEIQHYESEFRYLLHL
ncbi:hypothetical protein Scep_003244 [Stephania cephalantha]|uniref:DUF547 domain-containing protein n=1 Tax=Stephania cephalantha TaxID=152367 RepID=A0AAP0PVM7_9MAGN